MKLAKGDRVTYSPLAHERFSVRPNQRRNLNIHGTVTADQKYDRVTVLWDGRKTTNRFHVMFIRRLRARPQQEERK